MALGRMPQVHFLKNIFGALLLIYFLDLQLSFLDEKHGERHGIGRDWRMKWFRLIGSKIDCRRVSIYHYFGNL